MSHFQIPPGLTELLQGYTVEVLRRQPPDLVEFAVDYFTRLREARASAAAAQSGEPKPEPEPEPEPEPDAGPDADASSDSEDDEDLEGRRRRAGVSAGPCWQPPPWAGLGASECRASGPGAPAGPLARRLHVQLHGPEPERRGL